MIIQVKARLDEAWLESGEVSTSPNPQFGTELAWEVGKTVKIRTFRTSSPRGIVRGLIAGGRGAAERTTKAARHSSSRSLEELERTAWTPGGSLTPSLITALIFCQPDIGRPHSRGTF